MKAKNINRILFLKSFFYYLFHQKSEYQKALNKFCEDFFEKGLIFELTDRFNIDLNVSKKLVEFAKVKYGYDKNSIAAEETYQVKSYCFTKCYYNKLRRWQK
jgi:hypothetical protein